MLIILILIINILDSVYGQYGVTLSVENREPLLYEGYLWSNSKVVFLSPELRATVVKGISKSEKICGFELRSRTIKDVPFVVYLLDELSGVGELQVKPHVYLDSQSQPLIEMNIEAFDCDALPHYSKRAIVRIHVENESGPIFYNKSYTFFVRKDAKQGSFVGVVIAKSPNGNEIDYSLQHDEDSLFQIDQAGVIAVRKSLLDIKPTDLQIRVLAKERSSGIPKQSKVIVTIEMEPVCQNKLSDIPDELDYYIKSGFTNMMEAGQLIQQGHRPILVICHLSSPLKLVTLKISLKPPPSSDMDGPTNKPSCQTDIATARIQRGICGANPDTVDILLNEGGMINVNGDELVRPEIIKELANEFTLTWWMKKKSQLKTEIFCLKDDKSSLTISIEKCNLLINHPKELLTIEIPMELCHLNDWKFFAITQQWDIEFRLNISVSGSQIASVTPTMNLFEFQSVKLFVGRCSAETTARRNELSSYKLSTRVVVGVISMANGKPQKQDAIDCLSSCGEAIITAESITKLSKVSVRRKGSSLYLTSTDIPQLLDAPTKIHYINAFYQSRSETVKVFEPTDIRMDVSIECESKELITVPRAVMRINFIGPRRDLANDTTDVEIVSNATITATRPQSIPVFPNLRFINANTENPVANDLKIESCSIRLLQRNLVDREKIYLLESWSSVLAKHKMEIRSNLILWSIEGEADGTVYQKVLRHVLVDMIDERKKFSILCTLKGGDFTSQAIVEVIQMKPNGIHYESEDNLDYVHHKSLNERKSFAEKEKEEIPSLLNITKSKFIGAIIMAVMAGAAVALVTAAIIFVVIRKREFKNDRKRKNKFKSYSKNLVLDPCQPTLTNMHDVFNDYEYEEDRISMADIPDDEEQNLDNISCETCNMTDPEVIVSLSKSIKDIPRSKTISFPIVHRKF